MIDCFVCEKAVLKTVFSTQWPASVENKYDTGYRVNNLDQSVYSTFCCLNFSRNALAHWHTFCLQKSYPLMQ